jgi:hypothetical protein
MGGLCIDTGRGTDLGPRQTFSPCSFDLGIQLRICRALRGDRVVDGGAGVDRIDMFCPSFRPGCVGNVGAFGDIDHVLVDGVDLVSSEVL